MPAGAEVPEPGRSVGRRLPPAARRGRRAPRTPRRSWRRSSSADTPDPVEPLHATTPTRSASTPTSPPRPTPAFVGAGGAGAPSASRSPIDWTGQGGRVDERVSSSDDILRVSEATALPDAAETGGSELARLLAKVEARLRDYD